MPAYLGIPSCFLLLSVQGSLLTHVSYTVFLPAPRSESFGFGTWSITRINSCFTLQFHPQVGFIFSFVVCLFVCFIVFVCLFVVEVGVFLCVGLGFFVFVVGLFAFCLFFVGCFRFCLCCCCFFVFFVCVGGGGCRGRFGCFFICMCVCFRVYVFQYVYCIGIFKIHF